MGKKVMIVDDDPLVLAIVSGVLEGRGYEVSARSEARGTTVALMSDPHDVLVLDIQMPELGGDGLLRALANNARLGFRMPAVVIHSSTSAELLGEIARAPGVVGVLAKADATTFVDRLEALLQAAAT